MTDRRYGWRGSYLLEDPDEVAEMHVDMYGLFFGSKFNVEEWTVHSPEHHLCDGELVLDLILETACDNNASEDYDRSVWPLHRDSELLRDARALLAKIARKITFREVRDHVANLSYEITELDGPEGGLRATFVKRVELGGDDD